MSRSSRTPSEPPRTIRPMPSEASSIIRRGRVEVWPRRDGSAGGSDRRLPFAPWAVDDALVPTGLVGARRARGAGPRRVPGPRGDGVRGGLGVAVLGVIAGIFLAIALGLGQFVRRAWLPQDAVLGRVAGLKGYHDITRHPEGQQIPGLVLYRWDAPLFFANAGRFRERVFRHVRGPSRRPGGSSSPPSRSPTSTRPPHGHCRTCSTISGLGRSGWRSPN